MYLANARRRRIGPFKNIQQYKCVIVQATHCGSKYRKPLNCFWEFFFSISNEFRSFQSQFLQKLYSNFLKIYKEVHLILICLEWLLQLHNLCALSHQNWLCNKKDIKKNISQSRAKFVCSVPKISRVWSHWNYFRHEQLSSLA